MALACGKCKSDLVEAGVGNQGRCLSCGAHVDLNTRDEVHPEPIETVVPATR